MIAGAAKALGSVAGKAARSMAARKATQKSGGLLGLFAVVATLLLVATAIPVALIGITIFGSISAFAVVGGETDPSGPGTGGIGGTIPACAVLRPVSEVDPSTTNGTWSAEQLGNARVIIEQGRRLDWAVLSENLSPVQLPPVRDWPTREPSSVPVRAVQITLMTAMQESSLINLDHDDDATNPDGSVADGGGLFQQQPSQGWGTWEQITNPSWATGRFLFALANLDGWETLDPWEAAHRVQINDRASDYQKWWDGGDAATLMSRFLDTSSCATWPLSQPYNLTSGYGPRDVTVPGASSWHPAWDFANGTSTATVYAMRPGIVTQIHGPANALGITDPDTGAEVQYLHMEPGTEKIALGDTVEVGQEIGPMGNYGVSGGHHLDLRIYAPRVPGVPRSTDTLTHTEDLSSAALAGYVHPQDYASLFGLTLCPTDWCNSNGIE